MWSLALVRDDMVALDVPGRSLNLLGAGRRAGARKAAWQRRCRASSAAMACCTSSTSVRPIRAAISIFCRPKRALNPRANRRFINPGRGRNVHAPKAASDGAGLPRPGRLRRDGPAKKHTRRRHTWRATSPRKTGRAWRTASPFARPLHDHGHGLHHDRRGRGAGHVPVGYSSIPAPDSRHAQMASLSGKRIVEMVWEDLKPSDLLTAASL